MNNRVTDAMSEDTTTSTDSDAPTGAGTPRRTEYPSPWSDWLRFETELDNGQPIHLADPFCVDQEFEGLKALAAQGNLEAAVRLFEFVLDCEANGYRRSAITDKPRPSWTKDEFLSWAELSTHASSHLASMCLLTHAEALAPHDPGRARAGLTAARALLTTSAHGWLESLVSLAAIYERGDVVPQDLPKAFAYFQVTAAAAAEATGNDFYWEYACRLRSRLSAEDIEKARMVQEQLAHAIQALRQRG